MKRIFNKLKYITVAVLVLGLSGCDALLDDEVTDFGTGPNFVGFASSAMTLAAVTDGSEYQMEVPLRIIGPTVPGLDSEVTVDITVDPSSTAIEGTHFSLPSTTVTLTPSSSQEDVFTGSMPITILTEGLVAPLDETPVLVLNMTNLSTSENVVINDKRETTSINLAYACPFDINDFAGTYIATTDEFEIYLGETKPFEVVVGPGENQLTLVNFAAHPEEYDLVVDVDPATGEITVPKQVALNYNNFGATQYGELSMEGSGTSAAGSGFCIGTFEFSAAYTVAAGSFGNFQLVFERVVPDTEEGGETDGEETEGEETDGEDTGDTEGEA